MQLISTTNAVLPITSAEPALFGVYVDDALSGDGSCEGFETR